jgi:hypothetical protein
MRVAESCAAVRGARLCQAGLLSRFVSESERGGHPDEDDPCAGGGAEESRPMFLLSPGDYA